MNPADLANRVAYLFFCFYDNDHEGFTIMAVQVQRQRVKRTREPLPEPTPDEHQAEIAAARRAATRNR